MILCEFTLDGESMVRISNIDTPLTYQWYGFILEMTSVKFQLSSNYGGYAKPSFSDIKLSPEMFESGTWPPIKKAYVKIMWTETYESEAVTIFEGTALLSSYDRSGVTYNLKQPEFSATVPASTVISGTLDSVITTLCGASYLDVDIDTTNSRSVSPDVSYTVSSEVKAIDLANELCKFFTHAFLIKDSTLYLYDMTQNSASVELTEFDVLPCTYKTGSLLASVSSENGFVDGSYPNSDTTIGLSTEYCSSGNVESNLTNIKTVSERDIASIDAMITDASPMILDVVELLDESTVQDTTSTARIISALYNFDDEKIQYEAIGVIS